MLGSDLIELLLFGTPCLLYMVRLRRRGTPPRAAAAAVGLRPGRPGDYAMAAAVMAISWAAAAAALTAIPARMLTRHGVIFTGAVHGPGGYAGIVILGLAEEALFRGLIAGVTIRHLGFWHGNTVQALIFLAPHCLLLVAAVALWPILPAQFLAGWLFGWLRHRSGSIGPSWLAHAGGNLLAGL